MIVSSCVFDDNKAPDGNGGALASYMSYRVTITNSSFTRNAAGKDGGACWWYLSHTDVTIADNNFRDNTAARGIVYFGIYNSGQTLSGLLFEHNVVNEGTLYFENSNTNVYIINVIFSRNTARFIGGGIALYYGNSFVELISCSFIHNVVTEGSAGALIIDVLNTNVCA